MRILHVVPFLRKNGGGVSESVPNSCRALRALGHEVGIAVCEPDDFSESALAAEREGVTIFRFGGKAGRRNPMLFSWNLWRGLEKVARDYDVIHLRGNWLFPIWWGAHVARKLGKPYVMQPHGSLAPERLRISAWKKRLAGLFFDRSALRGASVVIATCEAEAAAVRAYVPGVKVVVIPHGVEMGRAGRSEVKGKDEGGQRTLLFFSRISYVKGLDILADAWARIVRSSDRMIKRWKLLIVGPDDRGYTEKMKRLFVGKCPAGSYEFCGPAYGDEKWRLLANADAFVLPTRNENFGIAVAEAMLSGLPVVCTKGAPWDCLEKENAGRWTDVSVEGVRRGLEDVLLLDDEDRRAMGERGRKWVEANCKWLPVAQKLSACYEGACPR